MLRDLTNKELPLAGMGFERPADYDMDGNRHARETLQTRPFNIVLISEPSEYVTYLIKYISKNKSNATAILYHSTLFYRFQINCYLAGLP